MKKTFILFALLSGAVFGQSGVFNVPYKQQPHIMIPHVAAPQTLVNTNGAIIPNPYRNLKYCDFVLKAIDQTGLNGRTNTAGVNTPILYVYASAQAIEQPFADKNATVYYQNSSLGWPHNTQRIPVKLQTFTNVYYSAWSRSPTTQVGTYPQSVVAYGVVLPFRPSGYADPLYYGPVTNNGLAISYFPQHITTPGQWVPNSYDESRVWVPTYTRWAWIKQRGTSFEEFADFNDGIEGSTPPGIAHSSVFSGGAIQVVSTNAACAIEIYPAKTPANAKWMKPGNPNIKWMCLLSNGIDFYRDASGNKVWFNVDVDWLDKIPEMGKW